MSRLRTDIPAKLLNSTRQIQSLRTDCGSVIGIASVAHEVGSRPLQKIHDLFLGLESQAYYNLRFNIQRSQNCVAKINKSTLDQPTTTTTANT